MMEGEMIGRARQTCAALCLFAMINSSHAAGNSVSRLIEAYHNWTVVEIDANVIERSNLPDSLHILGSSDKEGLSIDMLCMIRNVDPSIPNFGAEFLRGGVATKDRFQLIVSSKRDAVSMQMLTLPDNHSAALRLSSADFERICDILGTDDDVELSFDAASGQSVVAHINGTSRLHEMRTHCENLIS